MLLYDRLKYDYNFSGFQLFSMQTTNKSQHPASHVVNGRYSLNENLYRPRLRIRTTLNIIPI